MNKVLVTFEVVSGSSTVRHRVRHLHESGGWYKALARRGSVRDTCGMQGRGPGSADQAFDVESMLVPYGDAGSEKANRHHGVVKLPASPTLLENERTGLIKPARGHTYLFPQLLLPLLRRLQLPALLRKPRLQLGGLGAGGAAGREVTEGARYE